jgi:probable addiction module antidote protein
MVKIEQYQDENGAIPFRAWFGKLRDVVAKTAIAKRITDQRWAISELAAALGLGLLVSHDEWMIEELRCDPKFAAEYLKQSMADMSEPDGRGAALLALRRLAEVHGGMAAMTMKAGIQRESLYRALSPNGNPTMNTLIAVLKSLGMRLTVEPDKKSSVTRYQGKPDVACVGVGVTGYLNGVELF